MAIDLNSLRRGSVLTPPRLLIYGTHGVGKTTLACGAPDPVLIQTEDGRGLIDIPSWGPLRSYSEIVEAIGVLANEDHGFKTVIIDSLDWSEPLVWAEVCRVNGWSSIEEPGYGKGYVATGDAWRYLFDGLDTLRNERGMTVILIAHCEVFNYKSPETEPYDRYVIKLHKRAAGIVQEHVDCVFFMNWRTSIVKDKVAGSKDGRARGVGGGNRVLYTEERPAFLAKNRYSMPETITIPDDPKAAWSALASTIPYFTPAPAQAAE